MTGNSDNELGNPGGSTVPPDVPSAQGEPLYRPLRGWASAYQPEPSIWSKIGSFFSRKKKDEAEAAPAVEDISAGEPAEPPAQELEFIADTAGAGEDAETNAGEDEAAPAVDGSTQEEISEEYPDAFDAAFDAPRSPFTAALNDPPQLSVPPQLSDRPQLSDPAFFVPGDESSAPVDESPVDPLPPVREYQLRSGEEVDDLPVVRDYQLREVNEPAADEPEAEEPAVDERAAHELAAEETAAEPQFIPARSLLDDEPEEKKPGFFARLFGRGRKKAPEPVAVVPAPSRDLEEPLEEPLVDAVEPVEPVEPVAAGAEPESEVVNEVDAPEVDVAEPGVATIEPQDDVLAEPVAAIEPQADDFAVAATQMEPPAAPPRLDRPSLEFFMRVDRAGDADAPPPTLDDALPMGDAESAAPGAETADVSAYELNPDTDHPTQPWIPAIPDAPLPEKKPGFFARLFGRKSKPEPIPEPEVSSDESAEVFAAFDEPQAETVAEAAFSSVDDALPAHDVATDEPAVATPMSEDWSRFAPPSDSRSTLEVDAVEESTPAPVVADLSTTQAEPFFFEAPAPPAGFDTTLEVDAPPPPVGDSRSTLEMEEVPQPAAGPTYDGNMVDLDLTLQEPVADDGRSTAQVSPVDDDVTTGEMVQPVAPEVTAAMEADRGPFFVPKFRAFYNEIVSHKTQKAEFTAGFATAVMDYTADLSPDAAAQQLQKRLSEILELQAAEATWMGGEAAARYPDAQYAMAALADEVFAHIEWPGRDAWPRHMVEQRLFKSNAKDVEFFRRVDKLLKNESENPSAAAKDLARMYLLVLAAGFQGKYRPFDLTRPLAEYRRRLYEFVSGQDPLMIYAEERKLFPEAADRVVVGRAVSRFSMLQQWAAVLVILLIGYAVISQMAWNRVSADLKDVTARVEAANGSATSDGLAGDPR